MVKGTGPIPDVRDLKAEFAARAGNIPVLTDGGISHARGAPARGSRGLARGARHDASLAAKALNLLQPWQSRRGPA